VLEDTKHRFGCQNIAPIASNKVIASNGAGFAKVVNAISANSAPPP
jgi:hypothetical protein